MATYQQIVVEIGVHGLVCLVLFLCCCLVCQRRVSEKLGRVETVLIVHLGRLNLDIIAGLVYLMFNFYFDVVYIFVLGSLVHF